MLPSSASLSTRCPLPKPSPAVWRSPASPAARPPQSRLPVAGSPARSWRVVDSPGTNSSTWSQPGSLPRSTGGKATRILRRKEWASAPPARMTPPQHQGSPRTAQSSAPTCLGASSRRAPLPWPRGSVLGDRDFLVQWRCVPGCPFFLAPARFPRASRSRSSRWSWRSAPAARQGASDPARCAPPRPALDSAPGSPACPRAEAPGGPSVPAPGVPRAPGARSSGCVGTDPQSAGLARSKRLLRLRTEV